MSGADDHKKATQDPAEGPASFDFRRKIRRKMSPDCVRMNQWEVAHGKAGPLHARQRHVRMGVGEFCTIIRTFVLFHDVSLY